MAASLPIEPADLLITDELRHRIAHKADYQREKLAIQDLARQMAQQPDQVLPHLVHLAMELCGAHSAGISLYEAQPPGPGIFRWRHLAGRYAKLLGGSAPRDFSPSGVCFDVGHAILMARPERVYAFLSEAGVLNYEVLLVPLYAGQPDPLGTLWVISHDEAIHFDSGDARVMTELAAFAGLTLKMIQDASVLRASEERLNLALHQQEMLTREDGTGSRTFSPSRSAWFPSVRNRPLRRKTWPRPSLERGDHVESGAIGKPHIDDGEGRRALFHLLEPVGHGFRGRHHEAARLQGAGEPRHERLVVLHDQQGAVGRKSGRRA